MRILLSLALAAAALVGEAAQASVVPYPAVGGTSGQFAVTVNGEPVPVNIWDDIHYVHFAFDGTAEIEIRNLTPPRIDGFTISPRRLDVAGSMVGNTLSFSLDQPEKLIVDIDPTDWASPSLTTTNGDASKRKVSPTGLLFIFAEPLETDAPVPGSSGVFSVADFGIGGAISRAADHPRGGVAYFPPGRYSASRQRIPANTTVYLAPGAFVEASGNRPFLIENADNVRITGRGTLQARGTVLEPYRLSNFVLEGVILRNTWNEQWALVPRYLANARFSNIKVLTPRSYARDGIDPDNSVDLILEDSFVYSGDDSVCIKSSNDRRGYTHAPQVPEPTARLVVRDNVLWSWWSAMKFGSEIHNGVPVSDVVFEGNDVIHAAYGIQLLNPGGSTFTNVVFRDNRVEHLNEQFLYMAQQNGVLDNLVIEGLVVDQARGMTINGGGSQASDTTVNFVGLEVAGRAINDIDDLRSLGVGVNVNNAVVNFRPASPGGGEPVLEPPGAPENVRIE